MTTNATRQNAGHSLEQHLQHLEDRIEIQDLMVRYGLGQDLHEDGDNDVLAVGLGVRDGGDVPDELVCWSPTAGAVPRRRPGVPTRAR
ncbi:hypothetical protein ACIG3E_23580 [Streptomyces sp. NPDC053474]|uniref:hypothetical protein n=1 Tax=Streptomyces sp. NPDC053474 TaxID=3365704 RepID=UPI0037D461D1